jgi:hypothetical protein
MYQSKSGSRYNDYQTGSDGSLSLFVLSTSAYSWHLYPHADRKSGEQHTPPQTIVHVSAYFGIRTSLMPSRGLKSRSWCGLLSPRYRPAFPRLSRISSPPYSELCRSSLRSSASFSTASHSTLSHPLDLYHNPHFLLQPQTYLDRPSLR